MKSVETLIEDLVRDGLSGASQATLERLEQAFQEAARAGWLRLGLCLRAASEELAGFVAGRDDFSEARLQASLVRAWLLARRPPPAPPPPVVVEHLELVALGVAPRLVSGGLVAFDWRLRRLDTGQPLVWSCLVPHRWPADVPLEVMLAVPQKQGFAPSVFLEKRRVSLRQASLSGPRLSLVADSRVTVGAAFTDWEAHWDKAEWLAQLQSYQPTPCDSEQELQTEVWLRDYRLGSEGIEVGGQELGLVLPKGPSGHHLRKVYPNLTNDSPLYGLLHFHRGRLWLQPLSQLLADGPRFLTVDPAKVDRKLALKAFSFGKEKR